MKYDISIRVTFPEEITDTIRQEKQRFITEYGSEYKSEPHITLYLDSYTTEGYPKLLAELRKLRIKPFTISLLPPKIRIENNHHRNLYIMNISNKEALSELHDAITKIADPYRSPFIREKTRQRLEKQGIHTDGTRESLRTYNLPEEPFDPHITLGEIDFDEPQADITESQRNLKSIENKEVAVSGVTVFWYGKEDGAEKASLLEEIAIPFNQN
ncbi:MAG: 2'-5' RNA ligase family protein [Candidatus Pacebacteria bacterium]|nr:2'-5' RNA ligase family protein [Candidatus Paceibacterota bacterium]